MEQRAKITELDVEAARAKARRQAERLSNEKEERESKREREKDVIERKEKEEEEYAEMEQLVQRLSVSSGHLSNLEQRISNAKESQNELRTTARNKRTTSVRPVLHLHISTEAALVSRDSERVMIVSAPIHMDNYRNKKTGALVAKMHLYGKGMEEVEKRWKRQWERGTMSGEEEEMKEMEEIEEKNEEESRKESSRNEVQQQSKKEQSPKTRQLRSAEKRRERRERRGGRGTRREKDDDELFDLSKLF